MEKSAASTHTLYPQWPSREEANFSQWLNMGSLLQGHHRGPRDLELPPPQNPEAKVDIGKPTVVQAVTFSMGND